MTAALVKILKQVRKARKDHGLPTAYFVANRVQTNTRLARELLDAAQDIGVPMVAHPIHPRQAFALAPTVRKSVFDLGYAAKDAADDLKAVFEEIVNGRIRHEEFGTGIER